MVRYCAALIGLKALQQLQTHSRILAGGQFRTSLSHCGSYLAVYQGVHYVLCSVQPYALLSAGSCSLPANITGSCWHADSSTCMFTCSDASVTGVSR